ncbi:RsmB/NOP family class I SAM-dependent RNA methyltransferase [Albidovulum sp.]
MTGTDSARASAAGLVLKVLRDGQPVSDQLSRGALAALAPADRARAQRLALSTLRHLGRADRALRPFLRRRPPDFTLAVLRVAVVEMHEEGAPAHGVVSDAVSLTRSAGGAEARAAGMVNAVLRRLAALPAADWAALPPTELPGWLRGRLMSAWGKRVTLAIEAAHARGAALDLTPRDGDGAGLAARLGGILLPTGSVRLADAGQISGLPGYEEGDWWVQDAAAALPARLLAPRPGEAVLDLCAAPGGKTMQLAAAGARVTALDISEPRLMRLRDNLRRCRLEAGIVTADALDWVAPAPFDAVLLDAPCSATGTIRRHPDLPFVRNPQQVAELVALQARLIDRAIGLLAPGGRLVFATCSLLPEEGEAQIAAALDRHPGLVADRAAAAALPGIEPAWLTAAGGLRLRPDLWPDRGGMDGFFIACLRKP